MILYTYKMDLETFTVFIILFMVEDLPDPTVCSNPANVGECCGDSFDHKQSPGLCGRCFITVNHPERAKVMEVCFGSTFRPNTYLYFFAQDWPQCTGCSAQLKLLKGPRCGPCLKKGILLPFI
jgi:hypothetical protein